MKIKHKYEVFCWDKDGNYRCTTVLATNNFQHIYNETKLQGVSLSGIKKLEYLKNSYPGCAIKVRLCTNTANLIGWER